MRKGPRTAAELMAELEKDPKYQQMRREKEAKLKEMSEILEKDEAGMVSEIRELGYDIDSVWDFVNNAPHPYLKRNFLGEYRKAYPILLKHLHMPHEKRIKEGIIRALTEKDVGREIEGALLMLFKQEHDKGLRWVYSNALKTVMPYHRRKKFPEIRDAFENSYSS